MSFDIPISFAAYPLAVFLCYWMCLRGPLIFDDYEIEPRLQKWKWDLRWILNRQRPLSSFFLKVQSIWPNTLMALHGTNQILHFLCAFHVERMARLSGFDEGLAFFAGLLFCVHPLASNAVGWITGRHSLVAAFFGLGAAHAVLAGVPWLAFPLLALAFWSKEDAAGYAVTVGALLIYKDAYFWFGVLMVSALVGAILYRKLIHRLLINTGSSLMEGINLPGSLPQPQHAATTLLVTLSRLPRWAFGLGQAPYPGSGVQMKPADFAWLILFGALLYFIHPVAAIFILTGPWLVYLFCPLPDILMEHRNYSQVAGVSLALVAALDRLPAWMMLPAIAVLAAVTALRATAYSSVIQYWTESAAHAVGDASRAFQEMGAWMKAMGRDSEAEGYLREALRLNPILGPALNNMGWLLVKKGSQEKNLALVDKGGAYLEKCVKVAPRFALGLQDYGIWLENTGKPEQAFALYHRALELEPKMEGAINRLGLRAFYSRDFAAAEQRFETASKLNPRSLEYAYNLALTYKHSGRKEEAEKLIATFPKPCPVNQNMINPQYAE